MLKHWILKVKQYKILVVNFSYLSILQIFTLILPLLVYPYLIRILGKDLYGIVIIAQTVASYLAILVNFGFNISATKEVSIYRNNINKLSSIVSSILIIKAVLFLLSFVFLYIVLLFFDLAKDYKPLFYLCMWFCFYELIFPIWYFQGIEKMKYVTYITLISRIIFLLLIFIFISKPEHYIRIPIINGIGAIISGIISIYIVYVKHKLKFKLADINSIITYFKDGSILFLSSAVLAIKDKANILLIGNILGTAGVSEFDLAVKIKDVLSIPINLMNQSIYPKVSRDKNMMFTIKITKIITIIMFIICLLIFPFTNKIIIILGGGELLNAAILTKIMLFSIPVLAVSITIATNCINALGFYSLRLKGMFLTTMFFVILIVIGYIYNWTSEITFYAYTVLSVYIFELFIRFFYIIKYKLLK
jgi:PST family polysaccharide transporter